MTPEQMRLVASAPDYVKIHWRPGYGEYILRLIYPGGEVVELHENGDKMFYCEKFSYMIQPTVWNNPDREIGAAKPCS